MFRFRFWISLCLVLYLGLVACETTSTATTQPPTATIPQPTDIPPTEPPRPDKLLADVFAPPQQDFVLRFGGSQIAIAPLAPSLDFGNQFTLEAWVYLEAASPQSVIMGKRHNEDPFVDFVLGFRESGRRVSFAQSTGQPGSLHIVQAPSDMPLFAWTHVAATLDSGTMRLFVNGDEVVKSSSPGPPANTVPFAIGAATTELFDCCGGLQTCCGVIGALREARVWNRALTAAELKHGGGRSLAGNESGLVGYWPLDDGLGQAGRDLGPHRMSLSLGTSPVAPYFDPRWVQTTTLDGGPFFRIEKIPNLAPGWGSSFGLIDLGSDGDLDVVIATNRFPETPGPMYVLSNDGEAHFSDATAQVLGNQDIQVVIPVDIRVADFDGDGRMDILFADTGPEIPPGPILPGGQSRILMQTPDGELVDETSPRLPVLKAFTHRVCAADVDSDGAIDLYMTNLGTKENKTGAMLYINDGTGHLTADTTRLPSSAIGGLSCAFEDVNQDGYRDLVLHGHDLLRDTVLVNDGNGHFSLAAESAMPPRFGGRDWGTIAIATADFDGDGWPDLLMATMNNIDMGLQLLLNNGDGTFRDATDLIPQTWPVGQGAWVAFIRVADFNGDGWMDFLTWGSVAEPRLYLNTGHARFIDATEVFPVLRDQRQIVLGDLDHDGDVDAFAEFDYFDFIVIWNDKPFHPEPPND